MFLIERLWLAKGTYEKRSKFGFSLIETLVGLVVLLVVLLGVAMFMQSSFLTVAENRLRNMAISELTSCAELIRMEGRFACCKNYTERDGYKMCNITSSRRDVSFELKYKDNGYEDNFYNATVVISYNWRGSQYNYSLDIVFFGK